MSLRILHTSDVHLGMKFAGYSDLQSELSEARFSTLRWLVEHASKERCDLFVVAGDLFDRVSVAKKDVIRTAKILKEFQGKLVVVMPGNHDFISKGQTDLWTHFKDNSGDNILLLEEMEAYPLNHYDLDANLYPAPCYSKHSSENHIGWIEAIEKDVAVRYHIGVAHGSLEGISPDFDRKFNPMSVAELMGCRLDLWLMGHTHIPYPESPGEMDKIYYASTPEPDGFDCHHDGMAWIHEIDDDKRIKPILVSVGKYRFLHDEIEINDISDFESLKAKYAQDEHSSMLLKLKLKGRLPKEDYRVLPELRVAMERQLFYLQLDESEVTEKITSEEISRAFTEGSFPHRILTQLAEEDVIEALQIAYDMIIEGKS